MPSVARVRYGSTQAHMLVNLICRYGEADTVAELESAELRIVYAAQHFVDGWHRSVHRRPFRDAVVHAAEEWVTDHAAPIRHRIAFVHVANAIRVGRGHANAGPGPLLDLVDAILAE